MTHLEAKLKEKERELEKANQWIYFYEKKSRLAAINENNIEEFEHESSLSLDEYFIALDELEKSARVSPLEIIYYEVQLPDQLKGDVPLRQTVDEHLHFLERRGVMEIDIFTAKEIIKSSIKLDEPVDFETFIVYTISRKGKEITQEIYPALIKIFQLSGNDISKAESIYLKFFRSTD